MHNKSKEYKISAIMFGVAIVLFIVSLVTGLFAGAGSSINNTFMFLGFAFLCFGFVLLKKSKDSDDNSGK